MSSERCSNHPEISTCFTISRDGSKSSDLASQQTTSPLTLGALSRTLFVIVALLILTILSLRIFYPSLLTPVTIQRIQLFVFPIVVALLWTSRNFFANIPRFALGVSVLACVTATAFAYQLSHDATGRQVVVARFSDDKDEGETRVFASGLAERPMISNPVDIARFYKSFSKDKEVRKLFAERPTLVGVIWGSTRWANLSLPDRAPQPLNTFAAFNGSAKLERLSLVRSVPILGVSNPTSPGSRQYLSEVLNAGDDELLLLKTATIQDHWTTLAHRAYPLWKVATANVISYLESGGGDPALLTCGDELFSDALGYLRWGDNPDLQAAILNNRAIGLALLAEHRGERRGFDLAMQSLKAAIATKRQPNRYRVKFRAMRVASDNRNVLRGVPEKVKKVRKKRIRKNAN